MNRHAALAPLAAAAALAMAGISTANAQEATPWQMPAPSSTLTRAQVVAELQEWRRAGAHDAGNEAGISDTVLQRQVAMNRLAEERHARALELEQQRLAAEAAARAQPSQAMAAAPSAAGPAGAEPQTMTESAAAAQASPVPDSAPAAPADNPEPAPVASPDALTDSNRERQARDAEPMPMAPGRDDMLAKDPPPDVPLESGPVTATPQPSGSTTSQPAASDAAPATQPASPSNTYNYQEPTNKYPAAPQPDASTQAPLETEAVPEDAQSRPVR